MFKFGEPLEVALFIMFLSLSSFVFIGSICLAKVILGG